MTPEVAKLAHAVRAAVEPNGERELLWVEVRAIPRDASTPPAPRGYIPGDAAVALASGSANHEQRQAVAQAIADAASCLGGLGSPTRAIQGYRFCAAYGPRPDALAPAPAQEVSASVAEAVVNLYSPWIYRRCVAARGRST